MRLKNERPESRGQVRPEVTPELGTIVRKMRAKDPARGYQTPFEVAEALAPFADPGAALIAADAQEIAEAAARAGAAKPRRQPIRAPVGLAGFVAIAAIVGVLYIVLKQFELQTPPNEAPAGTPPVRRGAVGQPPGRFTMGIRELHRLDGHTGPVLALALSKDAKQLLSSGNDGTVRLWDLKEYKEVRQFQGHKDAVFAVAWSPDGRFAFSAGGGRLDAKLLPQTGAGDFAIRMWEVATGKEVRRFEGHTAFVEGLVCSADGQSILSGSNDGSIRLWETATGKETRQFVGHKGAVKRLSLSADGRFALSAGVDHTARIWEMPSGRLVHTLTTDLSLILGGVFRPDGKEVMLYSFLDGALRVWNVETGKEVRRIKTQDTGVLAAAFNASGDTAFSGGVAGTLQVWFPDTGAEGVKGQTGQGQILGLAVTEDAAIAAGGDGSIRFFMPDVPKMPNNPFSGGNPFGDLTKPGSTLREVRQFVGHDGPILAVAISPSGKYALSAGNDKTIRLWNIANGKEIRQFTGHEGPVACVAFSPDGQQALSGSADKTMRLWDVGTGEEIRQFRGHTEIIPGLAFLPDGKAVSASDDQTFRIWDLATGETIRKFEEPPGQGSRIGRIAVSADGKQMAAGGRGHALRLWDLETGQLIKTTVVPHTGPVAAVAYYEGPLFSTDDHFHMIVSGARNDTTLRAWMTTPREMASIFVNHNPVGLESVAVSVAGKKAIAGGSDGALSVCDVMFGREKGHSTAHTAGVMGVAFTPDGKQAISVSMDGTMRLWEIPN